MLNFGASKPRVKGGPGPPGAPPGSAPGAVQDKHYGAQLLSFVPNDKGKCKSFRTNAAKSMKPHPRGQEVSHQMWICGIHCKQISKHASKVSILTLNPPVLDFWRRLASISHPTTRIDVLPNFFLKKVYKPQVPWERGFHRFADEFNVHRFQS